MKLVTQVFFTDYKYFTLLYEDAFPKQKAEPKQKDLKNPWITEGLK